MYIFNVLRQKAPSEIFFRHIYWIYPTAPFVSIRIYIYMHVWAYIYTHIHNIHKTYTSHMMYMFSVLRQKAPSDIFNIYSDTWRLVRWLVGLRCITKVTYCNTLQHTAAHCNTLQHTATHCNALHHTVFSHIDIRTHGVLSDDSWASAVSQR